jgi:hypothetical protein
MRAVPLAAAEAALGGTASLSIESGCSAMNMGVRSYLFDSLFGFSWFGWPGSPGGDSLFFASPKKSKQKKGDRAVWVPSGNLR